MPAFIRQSTLTAVLALVAALLGVAFIAVDVPRATAPDALASAAATPATDPVVQATTPPGELVASQASSATPSAPAATAATAPAPPAPTPVAPPAAPTGTVAPKRGGVSCAEPHRIVQILADRSIHATPAGEAVATMPAASKYLGQSTTAWVQATTPDGRWGKVAIPWAKPVKQSGWIRMDGLRGGSTQTMLVADLSDRRLRAYRGCAELFSVSTAIGRPGSPSPTGRFWVSDRIAVPVAQQASFGTYAFGLSTVQPNLPAGWTGGDQMAIHGTGAPGSIGEAASAGCLRISEPALARLRPLLRAGTPVVIQA